MWFTTATYEHNIFRVANRAGWTGECSALGVLEPQPAQAQRLDVDSERRLYYPSNSPQARHIWKLAASRLLPAAGDEALLGCHNVYHECCCRASDDAFLTTLPCGVTHCNMGPAGGQRLLVRRSGASIVSDRVGSGTSGGSTVGGSCPVISQLVLCLGTLMLLLHGPLGRHVH